MRIAQVIPQTPNVRDHSFRHAGKEPWKYSTVTRLLKCSGEAIFSELAPRISEQVIGRCKYLIT
jgi:hypothetical protein